MRAADEMPSIKLALLDPNRRLICSDKKVPNASAVSSGTVNITRPYLESRTTMLRMRFEINKDDTLGVDGHCRIHVTPASP
jgi:hypothetical protein